jgi:hypothetical protein
VDNPAPLGHIFADFAGRRRENLPGKAKLLPQNNKVFISSIPQTIYAIYQALISPICP